MINFSRNGENYEIRIHWLTPDKTYSPSIYKRQSKTHIGYANSIELNLSEKCCISCVGGYVCLPRGVHILSITAEV